MPSSTEYKKILVRNGNRQDLPVLDSAEFGYAKDTGQVYIGSDPSQNTHLHATRIVLSPIPNARVYTQTLLDAHAEYNVYTVTEQLVIDTESSEKALAVMHFINGSFAAHYSSLKPIATISTNIELITSQNIVEYVNPSLDIVNYNPSDRFASPIRNVLSKILDNTSGDVFMQFNRREQSHVRIEYTLVQNNGAHKRSGVITLIADNNAAHDAPISISDDQEKIVGDYSETHIRFGAEYSNGKTVITFTQPAADTTKIFYRVSVWGLDSLSDLTIENIEEPDLLTALNVGDGDILGFNSEAPITPPQNPPVATTPSIGDTLVFDGSEWVPTRIKHPFFHTDKAFTESQITDAQHVIGFYAPYDLYLEKVTAFARDFVGDFSVEVYIDGAHAFDYYVQSSGIHSGNFEGVRFIERNSFISISVAHSNNSGSGLNVAFVGYTEE